MLRSQFGAGDWGLHCRLCLCMAICVRVPVGVRMAVLLSRHLAILPAVLAARRDILLHSMPSKDQPAISITGHWYPCQAENTHVALYNLLTAEKLPVQTDNSAVNAT